MLWGGLVPADEMDDGRQLEVPVVLPQIEMLPNNFAIFFPKSNVVRYENLSTSRSFLRDTYAGW